jgi:hypothetical protein
MGHIHNDEYIKTQKNSNGYNCQDIKQPVGQNLIAQPMCIIYPRNDSSCWKWKILIQKLMCMYENSVWQPLNSTQYHTSIIVLYIIHTTDQSIESDLYLHTVLYQLFSRYLLYRYGAEHWCHQLGDLLILILATHVHHHY